MIFYYLGHSTLRREKCLIKNKIIFKYKNLERDKNHIRIQMTTLTMNETKQFVNMTRRLLSYHFLMEMGKDFDIQ